MGKKISNSQQRLAENIGELFNRNKTQTKTKAMPLPVTKLIFDPENARKFFISPQELPFNINECTDQKKINEYNELVQMGEEIKKDGLINPISVYKKEDGFVIIAGHRRTLACIIAGIDYVDAIVREKPDSLHQIARLQWNENDKRKNLSLAERLNGLERLVSTFSKENENQNNITAALLSDIANCSLTQAKHYLVLLRTDNNELLKTIMAGKINNLEKAAHIARLNKDSQSDAIKATIAGMPLTSSKVSKESVSTKTATKDLPKIAKPQAGRAAQQITFGKTKNSKVAEYILSSILNSPILDKQRDKFIRDLDCNNYREVNRTFKHIIGYLEKNLED